MIQPPEIPTAPGTTATSIDVQHPQIPPRQRVPWSDDTLILVSGGVCYGLACLMPAISLTARNGMHFSGAWLMLMGWFGLFFGQFGWLANPILAASLLFLLLRRRIIAAGLASVALIVSTHTIQLYWQDIPLDAGSVETARLARPLIGCYLWWASMVLMTMGPLIAEVRELRRNDGW